MKKTLFLAMAALVGVMPLQAQNKSSLLQRINEIKSQTDVYFWDQYTHFNSDTAKVNATRRLLLDVNRDRPVPNRLTAEELMRYAGYISMDRGSLKQFFAYIKKADAASLKGGTSTSQASVSTPVTVTNTDGTPAVASAPVTPTTRAFVPDAFVQKVFATRKFMDVYKLLKSMQAQGEILQFGKLKDVQDYSSFDLILFDMQSQEVVTLLSPADSSGKRLNQLSGMEDSLDNYPLKMTAVIWYIK